MAQQGPSPGPSSRCEVLMRHIYSEDASMPGAIHFGVLVTGRCMQAQLLGMAAPPENSTVDQEHRAFRHD